MINYFWIEIKGKNPKRFLTKVFKQNINIEDIKYEKTRVLLKVSYEDYQKIKKIRTIYQINIIKTSGKKKLIETIRKYKISLLIFIISVFFVIFLSNVVFFITIETDSKSLKNLISSELKENGLTIYTMKKDYDELNKITTTIKNNNLDRIEWMEIEQKGVILKVKVIERVSNNKKEDIRYKDIVASKDGYIRKIYSRQGQLLKNIDDYVKKGEVIISGNIFRNEKVVSKVRASGKVYAEVWYIVKANKSLFYTKTKEKEKGNLKLVLTINNHEINIVKIPKVVEMEKENSFYESNSLKLSLKYDKNYTLIREKYSENELVNILENKAKKEIELKLTKDEYIIKQKTLKKYTKNGRMYIEVFFKTYEDIAIGKDLAKIEELEEKEE